MHTLHDDAALTTDQRLEQQAEYAIDREETFRAFHATTQESRRSPARFKKEFTSNRHKRLSIDRNGALIMTNSEVKVFSHLLYWWNKSKEKGETGFRTNTRHIANYVFCSEKSAHRAIRNLEKLGVLHRDINPSRNETRFLFHEYEWGCVQDTIEEAVDLMDRFTTYLEDKVFAKYPGGSANQEKREKALAQVQNHMTRNRRKFLRSAFFPIQRNGQNVRGGLDILTSSLNKEKENPYPLSGDSTSSNNFSFSSSVTTFTGNDIPTFTGNDIPTDPETPSTETLPEDPGDRNMEPSAPRGDKESPSSSETGTQEFLVCRKVTQFPAVERRILENLARSVERGVISSERADSIAESFNDTALAECKPLPEVEDVSQMEGYLKCLKYEHGVQFEDIDELIHGFVQDPLNARFRYGLSDEQMALRPSYREDKRLYRDGPLSDYRHRAMFPVPGNSRAADYMAMALMWDGPLFAAVVEVAEVLFPELVEGGARAYNKLARAYMSARRLGNLCDQNLILIARYGEIVAGEQTEKALYLGDLSARDCLPRSYTEFFNTKERNAFLDKLVKYHSTKTDDYRLKPDAVDDFTYEYNKAMKAYT